MERSDIVAAWNKFPRELNHNRSSEYSRPGIYLDETWINQNASVEQCQMDEEGAIGPNTEICRGGRFIITHTGSSKGFVPGALFNVQIQDW